MISKLIVAALVGFGAWYSWARLSAGNKYAGKGMQIADLIGIGEDKVLVYFTADEFGEWWPMMSTELLDKLDEFRRKMGVPVRISPAQGSLGRHGGLSTSQHNVDMWGEVRAADVMFTGVDLKTSYKIAKEVGFTGIGEYPGWTPSQGMHLDVRPGIPGVPATWAGLKNSEGVQSVDNPIEAAWA